MSASLPRRLVPLVATVIALAAWWLVAGDSLAAVGEAVRRIAPSGFLLGVVLTLANFVVAAARFRTLLRAYGANELPSLATSLRLYLVAHFFNTALPGNIAGDVLRGHLTRAALPGAGSYVVVLVERVFGLAGLLLLTCTVALLHGLARSPSLVSLTAIGVTGALVGATAPFAVKRIGARVGGRLERVTRDLPAVTSKPRLLVALGQSTLAQLLVALAGYAVLVSVAPHVSVWDAIALLPLATLAAYFPTLAGLGARELAYVALLAPLAVTEGEATAASLGLLATQLVAAVLGGALHAAGRRANAV